jgi:outer membrane protein OmpA-like peptidoglycan-associated protein
MNGCPDKDGDGIADKDDKCPDAAGKKEFNGCPDRDGDGIIDKDDACPDEKGLSQYTGCPDADGDGIPDNKDNCPEVAGIAVNKGCPEVSKGAVIQKIVYFNSDETIVLAQNIIDLNEIVAYMNENPDAVISVAGHTDSRESEEYNLHLSEKRADFVVDYLKKKGMTSLKINKFFFGKSKPVADNTTVEGRALNRRVEIKVTK